MSSFGEQSFGGSRGQSHKATCDKRRPRRHKTDREKKSKPLEDARTAPLVATNPPISEESPESRLKRLLGIDSASHMVHGPVEGQVECATKQPELQYTNTVAMTHFDSAKLDVPFSRARNSFTGNNDNTEGIESDLMNGVVLGAMEANSNAAPFTLNYGIEPGPTNDALRAQSAFEAIGEHLNPADGLKQSSGIHVNDLQNPEISKKKKKKMERFANKVSRDSGDVIHTFEVDELPSAPLDVKWDQDPELLCSYNWSDKQDGTNTIFVPGEPPKWNPPQLPHTLNPDSGFSYNDYNYARKPRDPYSPMFHALGIMNSTYPFGDVDVLADRNNLRVLLEFVQGRANGPFRLDLHLVHNTLVFVRKEDNYWKFADGVGYGGNFERDFTSTEDSMKDATNHYRVIRYPLGPLNVVVRFEADAYFDEAVDDLTPADIDAATGGLSSRPHYDYRAPIQAIQKGRIVPMKQMAELKSQAFKPDKFEIPKCTDQLWFGRTSHLFVGRYESESGIIKPGQNRYYDMRQKIGLWEEKQQDKLRKLVGLLSQLKVLLRNEQGPIRAVVLVREDKSGPVLIRTMEQKYSIVQRDFRLRHWAFRQISHQQPPQSQSRGQWNPGYGQSHEPSRLANFGGRGGGGSGRRTNGAVDNRGDYNHRRPGYGGIGRGSERARSGVIGGEAPDNRNHNRGSYSSRRYNKAGSSRGRNQSTGL